MCWTTAISSYNQTPYKARHGRRPLFHRCLSLFGSSRLSPRFLRLLFPLLLLHLLLEHLHEAAVVSERVSPGHRGFASRGRGAARGGRGAWVAAAAAAACLRFAVCRLWIHVHDQAKFSGSERVCVRVVRSVAVLRSSPLKNSDVNTLQDGLDPTRDSVYKKAPEIKWADAQSGTDKNANIKEKVQIKKSIKIL